jgi:uncharacterized protein YjbJ (UPF0337 family)
MWSSDGARSASLAPLEHSFVLAFGHSTAPSEAVTHRRDENEQRTLRATGSSSGGIIIEQWGKLTEDDLDVAAGRRDQMVGKLQERYGLVQG